MHFETSTQFPYPEIRSAVSAKLRTENEAETLDEIETFQLNLNVPVRLRGTSNFSFATTIRIHPVANKKARLVYNVDATKIYVFGFLMWLFLSGMAYLVSRSWVAIPVGFPGAVLVYFVIVNDIRSSLSLFERLLKKQRPINTENQ
jgi:hypothetical protein